MKTVSSTSSLLLFLVTILGASKVLPTVKALANNAPSTRSDSRRKFFQATTKSILATAAFSKMTNPAPAFALDMDAFINKELASDNASVKKELTKDEALCKYGQPGKDKGEACVRAGLPTSSANGKGVDAFGSIDRGDFVRCTTTYPMIDGVYTKQVVCK